MKFCICECACCIGCVMLCECVCVKMGRVCNASGERRTKKWNGLQLPAHICVSHSADVPLELHEGVCDEEVVLGGLAALQHHHERRGGAQ